MAEQGSLRLVRFGSETAEISGVRELMQVSKALQIVNDGKYVISAQECELLKSKGIDYTIENLL